ncbi:family 78 glycoside hydrolase catalytic domain [Paenibacillus sp. HB172176]|uniref:family 78 glycoside hydrolase catalytic domain n=1 Tax=Paenibacillus sp. HB172176 TaxID=2493690 RepID=UPI001F0D506E|nr:family 78 glycoside hydrolase catalytic domain [Paenibacillus sp. HB172176]
MENWNAVWITDPAFAELEGISMLHKEYNPPKEGERPAHPEHLKNRHVYFRKTFRLEEKPEQATLKITADDYYKLYVNGVFVGQGPAQGYPFHYNYNVWDVEAYLHAEINTIAVHVYYNGCINRAYNSGDLRMGMIAELETGHGVRVGTDRTWKYSVAPHFVSPGTIGYETQFAEDIDQRLYIAGWGQPGYDDASWARAVEKHDADYVLVEQMTPPLSVYRMAPASVRELEAGGYLIDFGHEITGQFEMKARGEAGEVIRIRQGEELEEGGGSVRYEMRANCRYEESWILSGGDDTLEQFDYKAFRYVEVAVEGAGNEGGKETAENAGEVQAGGTGKEAAENADELAVEGERDASKVAADGEGKVESKVMGCRAVAGIQPDSFAAIVRHYPLREESCFFESKDTMLQQIWDICKRGVQLSSQENYVDCPSREKGQYLGDNTIIGHTHMYISGDARLFKKAIKDFALSAQACPGLLAVAPGSFMQEIADFSLQWPMQLLNYYEYTGDVEFLREMHPVAEGILAHFRQYAREDGLIESVKDKWNLVDWPDNLRDGYDFGLGRPVDDGCHNVINGFYIGCVEAIQAIREYLRIPFEDELPALRRSFVNAFYREETKLFADSVDSMHASLHSNIFPLLYDIAPADSVDAILSLIAEKRLSCGVYMSYFLLKALAKHKRADMVYELIACGDERSWANMVREGATSCFEAWGKEQKWNTSLCHGWASAPIPLLIEEIIGLKPAKPGWSEIRFEPRIPEGMKDFSLEFPTAQGPIRVEYAAGELKLHAPEGVRSR